MDVVTLLPGGMMIMWQQLLAWGYKPSSAETHDLAQEELEDEEEE